MKVDVEKVKMDVEHSLLEWGVDPDKTWDSSERSRFKTFKKLAELTAIDYALSTTTSPDGKHPLEKRASELSKEENSFPAKPEQAAKYLLKDMLASIVHERGKVRTSIAKDAINMGFAPSSVITVEITNAGKNLGNSPKTNSIPSNAFLMSISPHKSISTIYGATRTPFLGTSLKLLHLPTSFTIYTANNATKKIVSAGTAGLVKHHRGRIFCVSNANQLMKSRAN
eukprot:CAMPEP_0195299686 /NCGR_PEP_ID=MMETSP0707-20130614/26000_1 /TAXON_ID=33640 /ORGANISM="Asterionellopsis glacialis, Strain CCMP134" /LENGTH=225 /DNA_ID=CAMNT_0040362149 /DNA_START=388 /DNA_END=1063 /DNA_ORIENTATION=+